MRFDSLEYVRDALPGLFAAMICFLGIFIMVLSEYAALSL